MAGRIGFLELSPFTINEVERHEGFSINNFWLRGGYPDSFLASTDEQSKIWLENYLRTYVERDIPQLGFQIPALQIRRLLQMCAHNQGQLLNMSKLAGAMGLTHPTIRRYIDLLEQTFLLRTLQPYEANIKKRLVKSPKVYIRDSGILHRLLQINDFNDLMGNPVLGASWEGLVIENVLSRFKDWTPYFYRTATGDEADLVLVSGRKKILIEIKASTAPQLSKGFWNAMNAVKPDKAYIIALIEGSYPIKENVLVSSLPYFLSDFKP